MSASGSVLLSAEGHRMGGVILSAVDQALILFPSMRVAEGVVVHTGVLCYNRAR